MSVTATTEGGAKPGLQLFAASLLEHYGGKRGKQAVAVLAAAQLAAPAFRWIYAKARDRDAYTVTVAGDDEIYPDLHEWVLDRLPEEGRTALIASTEEGEYFAQTDGGIDARSPRLRLRYDGSREQTVTLDGHKVTVGVQREDIPGSVNLPESWREAVEKITFVATSVEGRDAVVRMLDGLLAARQDEEEPPQLFMPSRYGSEWRQRGDLPLRTLDSVILREGQLERLVDDLSTFLAAEEDYNRLSQPWHRGYLFHGVPGTGKTSVARALAGHFNLPTYYLPLGDLSKDVELTQFVAGIRPRSVLLLEDIDVFHAATEREEGRDHASLAAMLNALDGIWTPHGLITIMTTNDRDRLDEALIRPGRIDVSEEFLPLDADQAERLARFFGRSNYRYFAERYVDRSPSEMIEELRAGSERVMAQ